MALRPQRQGRGNRCVMEPSAKVTIKALVTQAERSKQLASTFHAVPTPPNFLPSALIPRESVCTSTYILAPVIFTVTVWTDRLKTSSTAGLLLLTSWDALILRHRTTKLVIRHISEAEDIMKNTWTRAS